MAEEDIKELIKYWTEGEITNFVKVWLSVYTSVCFCYFAAKFLPAGKSRLLAFLPVVCLYLLLPLHLNSVNLSGTTAFFVSWLANFKLLLFAVGKGPLSDPSISFPRFLAIACLPIKIQQQPPPKSTSKNDPFVNGHIKQNPSPKTNQKGLNYAAKALLLALFLKVYDYSDRIHPTLILVIYSLHIYFSLELTLAISAALARALIGMELEPQFDEPYLSASLQEFWGRRWNLMVTRILRPTVYDPILDLSVPLCGRKWAPLPAIWTTFLVSGLIHELIFYYLGRVKPTWEITLFFLLHGTCLVAEVAAKKAVAGRFRLPRAVSTVLTILFVLRTGFWLFFPPLLRCKADVRAFEEYEKVAAFVNDITHALIIKFSHK